MKAILLIPSFLFSSLCPLAQDPLKEEPNNGVIKKGTLYAGAYFSFSTTNSTTTRVKAIDTETSFIRLGGNFTVGKMLSDHWGIHLNVGFSDTRTKIPQVVNTVLYNLEEKQSSFFISPALRHYRLVTEGIYVFFQAYGYLSSGTIVTNEFDKNDNLVTYSYRTNGYGAGISPGFTYFTSKHLSTEISIGVVGFTVLNGKDDLGNTTKTTTIQSLFYQNSVSLGFVYYF